MISSTFWALHSYIRSSLHIYNGRQHTQINRYTHTHVTRTGNNIQILTVDYTQTQTQTTDYTCTNSSTHSFIQTYIKPEHWCLWPFYMISSTFGAGMNIEQHMYTGWLLKRIMYITSCTSALHSELYLLIFVALRCLHSFFQLNILSSTLSSPLVALHSYLYTDTFTCVASYLHVYIRCSAFVALHSYLWGAYDK